MKEKHSNLTEEKVNQRTEQNSRIRRDIHVNLMEENLDQINCADNEFCFTQCELSGHKCFFVG